MYSTYENAIGCNFLLRPSTVISCISVSYWISFSFTVPWSNSMSTSRNTGWWQITNGFVKNDILTLTKRMQHADLEKNYGLHHGKVSWHPQKWAWDPALVKLDLWGIASHLWNFQNLLNFPQAFQDSQELHVFQHVIMGLCLSRERVPRKFIVIIMHIVGIYRGFCAYSFGTRRHLVDVRSGTS